jgi:hypothetical protein
MGVWEFKFKSWLLVPAYVGSHLKNLKTIAFGGKALAVPPPQDLLPLSQPMAPFVLLLLHYPLTTKKQPLIIVIS